MVHRSEQQDTMIRHVDSLSSTKYKKAPVRFRVEPAPQYCNGDGRLVASPGTLFEGTVVVQLSEPLAVVQLRLVFKLSEYLNYDAMGWGQRTVEDRVFSVRTILWGSPLQEAVRTWPIMEPGFHLFPFTCAMPNVNYPPSSLSNSLVSYAFHLVATLERPGLRPFQTEPCPVLFQPRIMTGVVSSAFEVMRHLGSISVTVAMPTTTFHIGDILRVRITATDVIHVSVALEQHFKVTTSTFHHSKTIVVKHVERRMDQGDILIPLDDGIAPAFTYGRKVNMRYQVKVVAKSRQGTLQTKKKTLTVPVYIGTTPETSEELVLPYTDEAVALDTTLRTKPKFLRHQAEPLPLLPAYDTDSPPKYCSSEAER